MKFLGHGICALGLSGFQHPAWVGLAICVFRYFFAGCDGNRSVQALDMAGTVFWNYGSILANTY